MSRALSLLPLLLFACDGTAPGTPHNHEAPHILHPAAPLTADLWTPLRFDAFELVEGGRDACCEATYRWTDGEELLGWGPSLFTDRLSLGVHTITLSITDPDGSEWSDHVDVTIAFLTPLGWDEGGEIYVFDGIEASALAKGTYPAFSPDGTELLYVDGTEDEQEIVRVGVDGTAPVFLTNDRSYDSKPTWSPDGTQFAWVHRDEGGDPQIWVGDVDGTSAQPATDMPLPADEPDWGPLGILFQEGGDGTKRQLYLVPRPGAPAMQVTEDAGDEHNPSWFSPGRGVLASRIEKDNRDIYHLDALGGRTRLTDHPRDDDEATLSPDGTKILFESDRSGIRELYVMRLDGSDVTRVPLPPTTQGRSHAQWGYGTDSVLDEEPTEEPPIGDIEAVSDDYVVSEGWPETLWLTANDTGVDLVVVEVTQPDHGEALLLDGIVQYVPNGTHLGPDPFTYVVEDASGNQANANVQLEVVSSYSEGQANYDGTPMLEVDGVYTHIFHDGQTSPTTLVMRESADGLLWGPKTSPIPASADAQFAASLVTWTDPATGATALGITWTELEAVTNTFHRWFAARVGPGDSFSKPVQISDHGYAGTVYGQLISLGSGELLLVSNQSGPNDSSVRRNRSLDGGLTWASEPTFGESGYYGTVTSAVADSNTVYVVTSADRLWKRNLELYISRDRGITFGGAIDITGYTVEQGWSADYATLGVAPDGRLHVVWEQVTPRDPILRVFYTTSDDGGTTWAEPFTQISEDVPSPSFHGQGDVMPRIRFGGDDRVYVLWVDSREDNEPEDFSDKNFDLYYAVSTHRGESWSRNTRINDAPEVYWQRGPSFMVEPGVGSDRILASWIDGRYDQVDDGVLYGKMLYAELGAP